MLSLDSDYFRLFGTGPDGFATFVEFFHLQDLGSPDSVRWLDGHNGREWRFDCLPLPQTLDAYRHYLDNVAALVAARNVRIRDWCETQERVEIAD